MTRKTLRRATALVALLALAACDLPFVPGI